MLKSNLPIFTLLLILFSLPLQSQKSHSDYTNKINEILESKIDESFVGMQASIIYQDYEFVESFGHSNIEFDQKMKNNHSMLTADLANQFIAYAILVLEEKSLLKLDDKISDHIKTLPDYMDDISILALLTHTHELPNWMGYQWLGGWKYLDQRSEVQMMEQLNRIKALEDSSNPYDYNSLGFNIAAKIIEEISGMPIKAFAQKEIFEPLGMRNSYFQDDPNKLEKLQAHEYLRVDNQYYKDHYAYNQFTPNRLYSSINDLNIWSEHLQGKTGLQTPIVERLKATAVTFPTLDYKLGLGVFMDEHGGLDKMFHNGLAYGNKSFIGHYFDQGLSIVIMANSNLFNASIPAEEIAEYILGDFMVQEELDENTRTSRKSIKVSSNYLSKHVGYYWNETDLVSREIKLENDTLIYYWGENRSYKMIPTENDAFFALNSQNDMFFVFSENQNQLQITVNSDQEYNYTTYEPSHVKPEKNKDYLGIYYSEKLDAFYTIDYDENGLFAKNNRSSKIYLKPLMKESFTSNTWYFGFVEFMRGSNNQMQFKVQSDNVTSCLFVKIQ